MKRSQTKTPARFINKRRSSAEGRAATLLAPVKEPDRRDDWWPASIPRRTLTHEQTPAVNFVTLKMRHHAGRSGYDRLLDYLDGTSIVSSNSPSMSQRIVAKLLQPLVNHSGSTWYHRPNLLAELASVRLWTARAKQVFHFLYGENSFRYLGNMKRFGHHAIIGTYHTPTWRLQELITKPAHLRALDAAVVVSTSQRAFFERFLFPEQIFFIPHGIDTDYFSPFPKQESDAPIRCIVVGRHLRDFETLIAAVPMLRKGPRAIQLVVVTQPDKYHYFSGINDVELHSGVSDDRLRKLYREADILLLPLLDCTANNALLEGMACGLPVVSTDLPAVRDYFDDQCGLLTPKQKPKALAEAVLMLAEQPSVRKKMAAASREAALRFAWPNVAEAFSALYRNVSG